MGDAGGHLADGGEALRMMQLRLYDANLLGPFGNPFFQGDIGFL